MTSVNGMAGAGGAVSFADLVTAATVGVSRRPLEITALAGPAAGYTGVLDDGDPAATLLDAAALLDAARRAGARPVRDVARPPAADADTAPELSVRAARVLRQIGGGQGTPGFAAADSELLAELLTAASEAGYLAPAPLLPDLLDAAVRTTALRPAVAAVLGARGGWLAAYRPTGSGWRRRHRWGGRRRAAGNWRGRHRRRGPRSLADGESRGTARVSVRLRSADPGPRGSCWRPAGRGDRRGAAALLAVRAREVFAR